MEKEKLFWRINKYMMGCGKTERKMDKEFLKQKIVSIEEPSEMISFMEKVFLYGLMANITKEIM